MSMQLNSIIVLICLISTVARYVLDSYLPSLPAMAYAFNTSIQHIQISLTLYLIGFSISQMIYGPLSDYYGRRKIIIIGLVIFIISNTSSLLSNSLTLLIITRLLAGIGSGCCAVLNRAIASDKFKGKEFARVWSYTTSTLTFTLILAPLIGGFIQDLSGWQANLLFTTAYVTVILLIIIKFLPETNNVLYKKTIKFRHIVEDYKTMLSNGRFIAYILCYTLTFAGLIAYFQVSPFLFINNLGYKASQYGAFSIFIALSYFIGGFFVQRFVERLGINRMLACGISVMILGGGLMLTGYLVSELTILTILIPAIIYVIGTRIVIPNAMAGSLEQFVHSAGCASGIIGSIQMSGSALVSFILSQFRHDSQLPLALALIVLALIALVCLLYIVHISMQNKPV